MRESFTSALRVQLRVTRALMLRELLTMYGRHNFGFLWLFLEPITYTVGVTILWSIFHRGYYSAHLSIPQFAISSYSALVMWRNSASRCCLAINANKTLLYHRNVLVIDFFTARLLTEVIASTASLLVLSLIYWALGLMPAPVHYDAILVGWGLLSAWVCAWGLLLGTLTERSDMVERLWHPIGYFMLPISGVFYMVDWLPSPLQTLVLLNPMVHCVELVRFGYFGATHHFHYDVWYVVRCTLVLGCVALALSRQSSRSLEPP